ncbi:MAG: hypothetical protein K0R26_17 [Bacteroidota bacterium]|jgi:hypothetical protein|nr:hypothetical protein [Bacteroidota bacterium]
MESNSILPTIINSKAMNYLVITICLMIMIAFVAVMFKQKESKNLPIKTK